MSNDEGDYDKLTFYTRKTIILTEHTNHKSKKHLTFSES